MKFLHLSDLHFGKMLHGLSLLENGDQPDWVEKLLGLVEQERPDAVVIAGDIYDRGMPPGPAVELFSHMVTGITGIGIPVLAIAGNHDSGQRLSCFQELLSRQNVYISGVLRRELTHVTLRDAHGPVTFWLLPYVFPAAVSQVFGDGPLRDYDEAIRRVFAAQELDPSRRNVVIAHQNVTQGGREGPRGGSESMVGGVGQVDYSAFDAFDYAALGHIHASYPVGREEVRYAGSPLCYHFDELRQPEKGPLMVWLGEKGEKPRVETLPILPLHPLIELRGTYEELADAVSRTVRGAYVKLVLTDRALAPEAIAYFQAALRARGSVLMLCLSEFRRYEGAGDRPEAEELRRKPVEKLFSDFYAERCGGSAPDEAEDALIRFAAELLRGSGPGADGTCVDPALAGKIVDYASGKK